MSLDGRVSRRLMRDQVIEMRSGYVRNAAGNVVRATGARMGAGGGTVYTVNVKLVVADEDSDEPILTRLGQESIVSTQVTFVVPVGETLSDNPEVFLRAASTQAREDDYLNPGAYFKLHSVDTGRGHFYDIDDLDDVDYAQMTLRGLSDTMRYCYDEDSGNNECIIDALVRALHSTRMGHRFGARAYFVNYFERVKPNWAPSDGLTINDVYDWIASVNAPLMLYCVDVSGYVFSRPRAAYDGPACNIVNMSLMVHDNHCVLLSNPVLKSRISHCIVGDSVDMCCDQDRWHRSDMSGWPTVVNDSSAIDRIVELWDRNELGSIVTSPVEYDSDGKVVVYNDRSERIRTLLVQLMAYTKVYVDQINYSCSGYITDCILPARDGKSLPFRLHFSDDCTEVVSILQSLQASDITMPLSESFYHGQTISSVSAAVFSTFVDVPRSTMGPYVRSLFDNLGSSYICNQVFDEYYGYNSTSAVKTEVDIAKCYSACLMNMESDYCVLSPADDFLPCDAYTDETNVDHWKESSDLPPGYYLMPLTVRFPWIPELEVRNIMYPRNLMIYIIDNTSITVSDITHWLKPSIVLNADVFKAPVETLYRALAPKKAKKIVNYYVGMFNSDTSYLKRQCIVGDVCSANLIHGRMINSDCVERGQAAHVTIDKVGDLYFLSQVVKTKRFECSKPIFSQVVAQGFVYLMELGRKMLQSGFTTKLLGARTDCWWCDRTPGSTLFEGLPTDISMHDELYMIGKYRLKARFAPFVRAMIDRRELDRHRLTVVDMFVYAKRWKDLSRDDDISDLTGLLITGPPGSGKSTLMGKYIKSYLEAYTARMRQERVAHRGDEEEEKDSCVDDEPVDYTIDDSPVLCCTTTGATRDELQTNQGLDARTWGWLYERNGKNRRKLAQYIARKEVIVVDECFQNNDVYTCALLEAILINPSLKRIYVGDPDQCRAVIAKGVMENHLNPSSSRTLMSICGGNRMQLSYIPGAMRFDDPLRKVVMSLMTTGRFDVRGRVDHSVLGDMGIDRCICKTNKAKKIFDSDRQDHASMGVDDDGMVVVAKRASDTTKKHQDMKLVVGTRLIAHKNADIKMEVITGHSKTGKPLVSHTTVRVTNGDKYTVSEVSGQRNKVTLTSASGLIVLAGLTPSQLHSFELDYAITAYRSQSQTMHGDYIIHEAGHMTFEELYVALSRATSLDSITFTSNVSSKKYTRTPYNHTSFPFQHKLITVVVYKIVFGNYVYVGRTIVKDGQNVADVVESKYQSYLTSTDDSAIVSYLGEHDTSDDDSVDRQILWICNYRSFGASYNDERIMIDTITTQNGDDSSVSVISDASDRVSRDSLESNIDRQASVAPARRYVTVCKDHMPSLSFKGNTRRVRIVIQPAGRKIFVKQMLTLPKPIPAEKRNPKRVASYMKKLKKVIDLYRDHVYSRYSIEQLTDPSDGTNKAESELKRFLNDEAGYTGTIAEWDGETTKGMADIMESDKIEADRILAGVKTQVKTQTLKRKACLVDGLVQQQRNSR